MMDPVVQYGICPGRLVQATVPGILKAGPNPENEVEASRGADRTMWVYVPLSGLPHAKQAQVLYILRDDATEAGAKSLADELALFELAEKNHVVVVMPDAAEGGWNFALDPQREDDVSFLVRCFASLKPASGVAAFNGMMFFVGATPAGSAMAWTLAMTHPLDAAAVMVGSFPEAYTPPLGEAPQVGWVYGTNDAALSHLLSVDAAEPAGEVEGASVYRNAENPCVCAFAGSSGLSAESLEAAWREMFAATRRWRNDTYGTYQPRIDFEARGFVAHESDTETLGLADGLPRTWYEYVPERLRQSEAPIPLVLYFHGVNCVGLYGAEQSGWADLADRDGFMVVFPNATTNERWNTWGDDRLPDDIGFVMALIEHMADVHPLDRSRVYAAGFSMGSMLTNMLVGTFPEVFAGGIAMNGAHASYLLTLDGQMEELCALRPGDKDLRAVEPRNEVASPTHLLADKKRAERELKVPLVQFVGEIDNAGWAPGRIWPVRSLEDGQWAPTIAYWLRESGISDDVAFDPTTPSGIASDVVSVEGAHGRLTHQSWICGDGRVGLYHLVTVARMPHAVDPEEVAMGWDIVRRFSRDPNGTLVESE